MDAFGLAERWVSGSSRALPATPRQMIAIQRMSWAIHARALDKGSDVVPADHQGSLEIMTKQLGTLNRGAVSDLMTILIAVGKARRWPPAMVPEALVDARPAAVAG